MARKRRPSSDEEMVRVNITLSPTLLLAVDAEAKKEDRSRSHMMGNLMAEALKIRREKAADDETRKKNSSRSLEG